MASMKSGLQSSTAAPTTRVPSVPRTDVSRAGGPGWFESSWELGRGLEIREGLPTDEGLNEWWAVCLDGPPTGSG